MATEIFEMGSVSSRGQVAIPSAIRKSMGLEEGSKILFMLNEDTLVIKKARKDTWEEITRPLKEAAKKAGLKEEDVVDMVHRMRKEHRANNR